MPPPTWMAPFEPRACAMGATMPSQIAPSYPRYHRKSIARVGSGIAPRRYAHFLPSSELLTTILFWPPFRTWGPGTSDSTHRGTPRELRGARPCDRTNIGSTKFARYPAAMSRRTRRTDDRRHSLNINNPAAPTSKHEGPHLFPRGKMGVRAV